MDAGKIQSVLTFAEQANSQLDGPQQADWLSRLEAERDGLQAALSSSLQNEDGGSVALRLCGALLQFWWMRGYLSEGRHWCDAVLASADSAGFPVERARVLNGAGTLARMDGDYAAARTYYEQGLAIRREVGDQRSIAASLNGLGNLACSEGDYPTARRYYTESLEIKRNLGDRKAVGGSLNNLGFVAYHEGDYPAARRHYAESLVLRHEFGSMQGIADSLRGIAEVAVAEQAWRHAARLWAMVEVQHQQLGTCIAPADRETCDLAVAAVREALGAEASAVLWAEGQEFTLRQSVEYALAWCA